ncbi:MAG: isochorismatase family protein [Pseudoclavibacter sp.]
MSQEQSKSEKFFNAGEHAYGNKELMALFQEAGFGSRVGWGKKPALVVIDMADGWLSGDSMFTNDHPGVVANISKLLEVFRERGLPIYFTTWKFDIEANELGTVWAKKSPVTQKFGDGAELIPELDRRPNELVINKPRPSAFSGTHLTAHLIGEGVDTIVLTGVSTSGCIRATAESAVDLNFHVIVPEEAVGDRSPRSHLSNLLDIDLKMGDVMPVAEVIDHLR